MMQQQQHDPFK